MTEFVACIAPLAARGQFSKDEGGLWWCVRVSVCLRVCVCVCV